MNLVSLALLLALASADDDLQDEPHVALLISVDDYGSPGVNLNSPARDTALLAEELDGTSFAVTRAHNVDRAAFVQTLLDVKKLAQGGVIFFYFSGHAVQVNGENWLIPRGAALKSVDQVPLQAVSVGQVLGAFSDARVRVVVLDACRTNPFGLGTKGGQSGLARDRLDDLDGTLISYAAAPGSVAYDGAPGKPSPFTVALAKHLKTPGLDLPNLFMEVRGDLLASTRDLPNGPQRSEEVSSLTARHRVTFARPAEVGGTKAPSVAVTTPPSAAPGLPPKSKTECSLAVLNLEPKGLSRADADVLPSLLAEIIANEVAVASGCHVLSQGDLKGMVDFEATRTMCGENEASCAASLGDALGVDGIVVGTVGQLGTDYVIAMRLVDNKRARVTARSEQEVKGVHDLRGAVKLATSTLFDASLAPTRTTKTAEAKAAAEVAEPPNNVLLLSGVGVGVFGVLGLAGGAALALDADARLADPKNQQKPAAYTEGRVALGLASVGVLGLAAGITLTTLGVLE